MPQVQQANGPTRSADDMEKYFDALYVALTTRKEVLEELVKANAALTTTNAELLASVASLVKANKKLFHQMGNRLNNKNCTLEDSPAPRPKTLCPHCNIEVMHAPNNYFNLEKNSNILPRGWKSRL